MSQDETILNELHQVRRSAIRTCAIVLLLTSGIAPAICWFWAPTSAGGLLSTLWQVGLKTYPLTLAVAFFVFCRKSRLLPIASTLRGTLVVLLGIGMASTVQHWNGTQNEQTIQLTHIVGDVFGTIGKLAREFGRLFGRYGASNFFASIVIGGFCGKTASRLFPYLQKGTVAAGRDEALDALADRWNNAA